MDGIVSAGTFYLASVVYLVVGIFVLRDYCTRGRTEFFKGVGTALLVYVIVFYPVALKSIVGEALQKAHLIPT
jgi:hypothetical protein